MSQKYLIIGRDGQLGKALVKHYPLATALGRKDLDISDKTQFSRVDWSKFSTIINAAAYVNADKSERDEFRGITWKANAEGPRNLAEAARREGLHLIHVSSEYVFDGRTKNHLESEPFSPLSVYGQSKAAGDIAVAMLDNYHILRTSWVVGDGHNFVKTMKKLADSGINPRVVDDQFGRLTFVSELVRAIDHILVKGVAPGTYNLSNGGQVSSWAQIAAETFAAAGHDPKRVEFISTAEYAKGVPIFAPRPRHSDMDLSKILATGFESHDWKPLLKEYVRDLS